MRLIIRVFLSFSRAVGLGWLAVLANWVGVGDYGSGSPDLGLQRAAPFALSSRRRRGATLHMRSTAKVGSPPARG